MLSHTFILFLSLQQPWEVNGIITILQMMEPRLREANRLSWCLEGKEGHQAVKQGQELGSSAPSSMVGCLDYFGACCSWPAQLAYLSLWSSINVARIWLPDKSWSDYLPTENRCWRQCFHVRPGTFPSRCLTWVQKAVLEISGSQHSEEQGVRRGMWICFIQWKLMS